MGADLTGERHALFGRPPGFSLIESILAMAILTTGCLGVIGMLTITSRAASTAAAWDRALALAGDIAELKAGVAAAALRADDRDGDEIIGRFHRHWEMAWDASTGLANIMVEVEWSDRGQSRRLTLGLLRADPRRGGT